MIKGREWRTLKGQLVLTGGMCGVALVAAIFMATQVSLAEKYIREKYDQSKVSDAARELIKAARSGKIDRVEYLELEDEGRAHLYQDWMTQTEPSERVAVALMTVDPAFYVRRVERTIVCGNDDQRKRAIQFLLAFPTEEAVPALDKMIKWAARRNLPDLEKLLTETRKDLKNRLESTNK